MARFGVASQGRDALAYVDSRLNTVPTVDSNRDPTVNDTNYPIQTIWRNQNTFRECMLVGFTGGQAIWRCFTDGDGSILELRGDDSILIQPNAGIIDIQGETVANSTNAKPVYFNGATANTGKIQVQLGTTVSPTPADNTKAGLLCANINQFDIDATSGMFSLKGDSTNPALTKLAVDFNTAPGTNPVVPSNTGQIQIFGNTVANATNTSAGNPVPVATHSRAVNQTHVDVQIGAAIASDPGNPDDVGLMSADASQFTMSSNGFLSQINPFGPSLAAVNLGISYSSPTFTIHAADGSALSATNPAYVYIPSVTTGQIVKHKITENFVFDDDSGTSDLTGNLWGTTTAIAWDNDMPFFIYAVAQDSDAGATFMITRLPSLVSSPAAANIATTGSAVASTQGSMFALDGATSGTPTVANFDSNPCLCIGAFRMRKNDAANDDWTVQALNNLDGMGRWHEQTYFNYPANQNGATSAYLSSSVGGDTIPTFQNVAAVYRLLRNGTVHVIWNFDNITVSGVGAGDLRWHLPFVGSLLNVRQGGSGDLIYLNNGAGNYQTATSYTVLSFPTYMRFVKDGAGTALMTPADLTTDKKNGALTQLYEVRNA